MGKLHKKYIITWLYIMIVFFIILVEIPCSAKKRAKLSVSELQTGLMLDCGRRFYSYQELKGYIDMLSRYDNSYLHLHLTDNQLVSVECTTLGQKAKYRKAGTYYNKKTKQSFLSKNQIRRLIRYADKKGVVLIPEIDMPAHMGGFFRLARNKYGSKYQRAVAAYGKPEEGYLNLTSKKGKKLKKALWKEYANLFAGCRYFHIGCDEYWGAKEAATISYINAETAYFKKRGFQVLMWNDALCKNNLSKFDSDIIITYWSYDGNPIDESVRVKRRDKRATAQEVKDAGFSILNYNSYYLYMLPTNEEDAQHAGRDIQENWNLLQFDRNSGTEVSDTNGILGASIAVWNENTKGIAAGDLYEYTGIVYDSLYKRLRGNLEE